MKSGRDRQLLLLRVHCSSEQVTDAEKESKTELSSPSTTSGSSISAYNWCAALGGIGFLETSYLTYLKLTESEAFCPVSGGSCGDILNSSYSYVFGNLLKFLMHIDVTYAIFIFLSIATLNSVLISGMLCP